MPDLDELFGTVPEETRPAPNLFPDPPEEELFPDPPDEIGIGEALLSSPGPNGPIARTAQADLLEGVGQGIRGTAEILSIGEDILDGLGIRPLFSGREVLKDFSQLGEGFEAAADERRAGGPTVGGFAGDVIAGVESTPLFFLGLTPGREAIGTFERLTAEGIDEKSARRAALGTAAVNTALEYIPLGGFSKRFLKGVTKPGARDAIDSAYRVLAQAGSEGTTEAAQEIVQNAFVAAYDPDKDVFDPAIFNGTVRAFGLGATVGTGFGATGVAIESAVPGQASAPPEEVGPPAPPETKPDTEVGDAVVAEVQELAAAEPQVSASRANVSGDENIATRLAEKAKRNLLEKSDELEAAGHQGVARNLRRLSYGGLTGPEFVRKKAILNGRRIADAALNSEIFDNLAEKLKVAPEESQLEAYLVLVGESEGATLDPELREAVVQGRAKIDANSLYIKDQVLGVLREAEVDSDVHIMLSNIQQVIDENIGNYVARFYKADHVKGYRKLVDQQHPEKVTAALDYLKDKAEEAGKPISDAQAVSMLDAMLKRHTDPLGHSGTDSALKVPNERLRRRQDIPEPIREVLGEVKEAGIVVQKTLHDQAAIVENFRFMQELAEFRGPNGERFAFDEPSSEAGALDRVPAMFAYGPMAGKYVTPEIRDALYDHTDSYFSAQVGLIDKYLARPFRKAKTVYNPGTHARNVLGNFTFAELANNSIANPRNHPYYLRAVGALMNKAGDDFLEAAESGALGSQFFKQPSVERALRNLDIELKEKRSVLDALEVFRGQVDDTATGLYIAEDQVFRLASYFKQRANGRSAEEAATWTNLFFPDYDTNPEALKMAERNGITRPFLSFFFQMPRIMANAVQHNPVKLGVVTAAAAALQAGLGRVDWDERERELFTKLRDLMPEYAKAIIPVAWGDELRVVSIQNIYPFADLAETALKVADNPVQGTLETLTFGTPFAEGVIKLLSGKDSRGFPARLSADVLGVGEVGPVRASLTAKPTAGETAAAAVSHFVTALSPPLLVGSEARRVNAAIREQYGLPTQDKYGRENSLSDGLLGIGTGIRPQNLSWDVLHYQNSWGSIRDLEERLRRARNVRDAPGFSRSEKDSVIEYLSSALDRHNERMAQWDEALRAAEKLGGTMTLPKEKAKALKSARKGIETNVRNRIKELARP